MGAIVGLQWRSFGQCRRALCRVPSVAGDLVPGDGNDIDDVYVRDVQTNTNTRVSIDIGGADTDGASAFPAISGDARYVAFRSNAI